MHQDMEKWFVNKKQKTIKDRLYKAASDIFIGNVSQNLYYPYL